ncbi:MAG: hypothetical protein N3A61_05530, partial [Ignavibacteria bacterium]|nr:hypothetical protein [Ignavibacteria bacterium]
EPRRYCQYQVRFGTTSLFTPKIDQITVNYDKKLLAQSTDASISPQYSTILQENTFTYAVNIVKGQNEYGIDTLVIFTPTPSTLLGVSLDNNPIQYTSQITPSRIKIAFSNSITASATLRVQLKFTPFLGINRFNSYFVSKSVPGNPQIIDTKKSKNVENWSVVTTDVPSKLLIETKIAPNPFSPNGDGLNDKTKITFFLANIAEPKNLIGAELRKLRINIYDLNGRLQKTLFEGDSGAAAYVAGNGIEWDGRGDNGKVLRPGVYIVQIYIDSDNGGEQVAKTVTVVY